MTTNITLHTDGDSDPDVTRLDTLDVQLRLEHDGERTCLECGQPCVLYPAPTGWVHSAPAAGDPELCGPFAWSDLAEGTETVADIHALEDSERADRLIANGIARCAPGPTSPAEYVNWVGVEVLRHAVETSISTGDPRGAFRFRVHLGTDPDGKPCVYLNVPQPDDSFLHATLTEVRPGCYRVTNP